MIHFNKPYLSGKEMQYINEAVLSGKISGNGTFTRKCQAYFEDKYGFKKALMTTSCTDALEMAAILANIKPGDEVIVPSYTFVSTALAFVRQGAKIIFADSRNDHPNIDEDKLESLISLKTKAIVPVHYAGVACNMDKIIQLAQKYKLTVIEDAAQAIDSYYKNKPLGSIGHLATFSFHETKNINAGEGGLLAINDPALINRAEIIWEKGTNRAEFFRGEVNKYGWKDIGSSFLPSEIVSAYLWAQIESLDKIQKKRMDIWDYYYAQLKEWSVKNNVRLPKTFDYATNNGHMFYMVCDNGNQRDQLLSHLKSNGILAVFHYLSLHKSDYYSSKYEGKELVNANNYSDCLIRLPLYFELTRQDQDYIIEKVKTAL